MRILVGHVRYSSRSSYFEDWLEGIRAVPSVRVTDVNIFGAAGRKAFQTALPHVDAVVLLHSCLLDSLDFVRPLTGALQARRARLAAFLGNEYNNPVAPLSDKIAWLTSVGADLVLTQLPQSSGDWLYSGIGGRVLSLPHALNPAAFPRGPDEAKRLIDIGTLSFVYPLFLGEDLRHRVLAATEKAALARGWYVSISTERRLDRRRWAGFLRDCRLTLATEAGARVVDRSDALALAVETFVSARRGGLVYRSNNRFRAFARRVPWPVKEGVYRALSRLGVRHEALRFDPELFAEVRRKFFDTAPPTGVSGKCVSARHFDAAGSNTAQILTRGSYNGIFRPDEHYFALDEDLGNIESVLDRAADPGERRRVATAAYELAMKGHTIRHRVARLVDELG